MKKILSVVSVFALGLATALTFADDKPTLGCGRDCGSAECRAACKNMACCNGGRAVLNTQPQRFETNKNVDAGTKPAVQARQRTEQ